MTSMKKWNELSRKKPDNNEPVLCLLHNGQQVTLAFDEENYEWAFYDDNKLVDAQVVAWIALESREEILNQLNKA